MSIYYNEHDLRGICLLVMLTRGTSVTFAAEFVRAYATCDEG